MSIKALQDYTYIARYARFDKNKKRRETWQEAIDRVQQMHINKFPHAEEIIKWAFDRSKNKKVLGSQRALQFGGTPIEKHNARMYNCTASYCDRLRFFQECMYLLLCGCGTGFSVQKQHVAKLPNLTNIAEKTHKVFQIPDSIEGWADAIGVLLSSYFEYPIFREYYRTNVIFDFSLIRPAGSEFSHGVGKAPGPDGLKFALEKIKALLDRCLQNSQTKLRPIDAYDIVMHSSDAVLSGGVRRSATLCLFSPDDEEMLNAKTGNWFHENPQRGRSNNSALLLRNETTKEQFHQIMTRTKEFGEPGFIWADSTEVIFNPCVEISLYAYNSCGESGWQMCNLCEINGKKIKSKQDFEESAKAGAIIGTLQASYATFPYLGKVTEEIVRREALLGVSITGMMDSPDILFNEELQREMAELVKNTNKEIAAIIGINPAARTTCVKPAGTTSCILGTSSGIHAHKAKRYFRRVQENNESEPLKFFSKVNPLAVEDSVWSANKTDSVITFCIEVPDGAKIQNQVSALQLLEYVKLTKINWVNSGTNKDLCVKPWLSHNVSNTINVAPNEWDKVEEFIYNNREHFGGISLLPISGDKDYQQAPFCSVFTPREIVSMYGDASVFASGIIENALRVFDGNLWDACDAALGTVSVKNRGSKKEWVESAKKFANKYFYGDIKKMTYCLKDVYNWKLWLDLNNSYQEVDYTLMIEEEDNTKLQQTVSCAGGTCEII